jgi:hypothetical protein
MVVIYRNKKLTIIIPYVVIEVFAGVEVVVDEEVK